MGKFSDQIVRVLKLLLELVITWSNTAGVVSSDNQRATVATAGTSRELIARGFGFNLDNTDVVEDIELEIERRSTLGNAISLITPWQAGENSEILNFPINAGINRTLILFVGAENGTDVLINNISIGGRQMTRLLETSYETSFWAHTECWYLQEADIALLTPGNYDIDVTYDAFTNNQFFDILSAALFSNVDQGNPFFSFI